MVEIKTACYSFPLARRAVVPSPNRAEGRLASLVCGLWLVGLFWFATSCFKCCWKTKDAHLDVLWVGCWCLWGVEQPGTSRRWGWVLPGAWLEKLPWFYHAFSRDARCFAQIPLSSYLNVNTYRSIDGTWKSWVFHEHSVSLFLSCILCRTSQQQQSNFFQMIRNTFSLLVFKRQYT